MQYQENRITSVFTEKYGEAQLSYMTGKLFHHEKG